MCKIKCFYRLECQQNYHRESNQVNSSYLPIMLQIADFFDSKFNAGGMESLILVTV